MSEMIRAEWFVSSVVRYHHCLIHFFVFLLCTQNTTNGLQQVRPVAPLILSYLITGTLMFHAMSFFIFDWQLLLLLALQLGLVTYQR